MLAGDSPLRKIAAGIDDFSATVHLIDQPNQIPAFEAKQSDRVVVGSSLSVYIAKTMLYRAMDGRIADVTLLLDEAAPPNPSIGYRFGPWLREIAALKHGPEPERTSPSPAPVAVYDDLHDFLASIGPRAYDYTEVPCLFPLRIQIQTTTVCEANCRYCPHRLINPPPMEMEPRLFERIIDQCAEHRPYSIELYFHAEPLHDPALTARADLAKCRCPDTLIQIATHERMIDAPRTKMLADSGIDVVFASLNFQGKPDLDLAKQKINRLSEAGEILRKSNKVLVMTSLLNMLESKQARLIRRLCDAANLPLESYRATTRAGDADVAVAQQKKSQPIAPCHRPFVKAYIRAGGELALCCEDWRYRTPLGNAAASSIAEIWQGEAYREIRRKLLAGQPFAPCSLCDF